jgi:hypothetical protein
VLADALYGNQPFMDGASSLCGDAQAVSQLHCNQKVRHCNSNSHFDGNPVK